MGQVTLEYGADRLSQKSLQDYILCCRIFQKSAHLKELHCLVLLPPLFFFFLIIY